MGATEWIAIAAAVIALVAAAFSAGSMIAAIRQAGEARESRHAAQAQAAAAKDSAEIAESGVTQSRRSAQAAEESAAEARKANEYASEQLALARADREDREHQGQRAIVIEVLRTGRRYANSLEMMITVMGAMPGYIELTQMESWNTFTDAGSAYDKARLEARYAVKASDIADVVRNLETVGSMLTERTTKLIRSKRDARGHAPLEDILLALEIPRVISDRLDRLEELANQHFGQSGEKA
ncbi:hypothetical protein JNUCC0626_24570 [Lentzea sp. JNUCC 0626]|uniref:hypothetical protein n=1 Tax=Lentzea sp. JNUCC 0626 TaxID=3367513 RepID=UPI003749B334